MDGEFCSFAVEVALGDNEEQGGTHAGHLWWENGWAWTVEAAPRCVQTDRLGREECPIGHREHSYPDPFGILQSAPRVSGLPLRSRAACNEGCEEASLSLIPECRQLPC